MPEPFSFQTEMRMALRPKPEPKSFVSLAEVCCFVLCFFTSDSMRRDWSGGID